MTAYSKTKEAAQSFRGRRFRLHELVQRVNAKGVKYSETCISARWRAMREPMRGEGWDLSCWRDGDVYWYRASFVGVKK